MSRRADAALAGAGVLALLRCLGLGERPYFVDESLALVTGWQLSRGARLYEGAFSHHMPFESLVAALAVGLGGPAVWPGRLMALGVWLAAGLMIHLALRRRGGACAWVGPLFLLLGASWAPLWNGHMLLVELYWSLALCVLAALWAEPFTGDAPAFSARRAFAAGAAGALAASCSLAALLPALLLLGAMARRGCFTGRRAPLAAGAASFLLLLALWGAGSVAWGRLWHYGVVFNTTVYARHNDVGPLGLYSAVAWDALRHWLGLGPRSWGALEPVFTAAMAGSCWALGRRLGWAWAAWALVFFAACRLSIEAPGLAGKPLFHASAYYALCALGAAGLLSRLVAPGPAAWILPLALAGLGWLAVRPQPGPPPAPAGVAQLAGRVTGPEERVWFLPSYPQLNLDSGRLPPAYPLYLPWAAEAEGPRLLAELELHPPALVFMARGEVGGAPWPAAGDPVVSWVRGRYQAYRLDRLFGGRILGPAKADLWHDGLYVLKGREAELLRLMDLEETLRR